MLCTGLCCPVPPCHSHCGTHHSHPMVERNVAATMAATSWHMELRGCALHMVEGAAVTMAAASWHRELQHALHMVERSAANAMTVPRRQKDLKGYALHMVEESTAHMMAATSKSTSQHGVVQGYAKHMVEAGGAATMAATSWQREDQKRELQDCAKSEHGGGKRCTHDCCDKSAKGSTGLCKDRGGGKCCTHDGCDNAAKGAITGMSPPNTAGHMKVLQ